MIFATGNKHKLRELRALLPGVELEPLPAGVVLPPEDGESYAEIALEKARVAHRASGEAVVADDSGIGAAALGGVPGILLGPLRRARGQATRRTSRSCCARSRQPAGIAVPTTPAPWLLIEADGTEQSLKSVAQGS